MLGAVIGDIAGSRFEWQNIKSKDFALFSPSCSITDDSVMTLAVAQAVLDCKDRREMLGPAVIRRMQNFGRRWAQGCYGGSFARWLMSDEPCPYGSYGNGAAMRVSACAWAASSLDDALDMAYRVTAVTHDHPEGLKGAAAVTAALWLARQGHSRESIREHLERHYYRLDFALDQIRPGYGFDMSCQGSVPQALTAFLESTDFEDAVRNAVSLGGDSDTIAAIAGSVAEAFYGIPRTLRTAALTFLDNELRGVVEAFEARFPARILD
jgi:type I restriction enzyme M protein